MKTILSAFALLCMLPFTMQQTKGKPAAQPGIKVQADYLYISEDDENREKRTITLFLDSFLEGCGTFTEQEGPHQLTLSDPEETWSIPLHSETGIGDSQPLVGKLSQMRRSALHPEQGIKTWSLRLTTPRFHLPPSTTRFRIKGHLVFHLAGQIHFLPSFHLLQKGKGRTLDIPLPTPEKKEGDLVSTAEADTAVFTSSTPSPDYVTMKLKYNPSRFQFVQFLLMDQRGKPAAASYARSLPGSYEPEQQEYVFRQEIYSEQDWSPFRVKLSYVNPEETRRIVVPVDMEVNLARTGPPSGRSPRELAAQPAPSPVPSVRQAHLPEEKVHFAQAYFQQDQHSCSNKTALLDYRPYTKIDFRPEMPEGGPAAVSISPEAPLTLKGDETSSAVSSFPSSHMNFPFQEEALPTPILRLNIPGRLPETSSCWTLSGTVIMTVASHACRISFPLAAVKGSTADLPLQDIPGGKFPKEAKATLTVAGMESDSQSRNGSLILHLHSTLPSDSFGPLTLIDAGNRRYSPAEPVIRKTLPPGVARIYKPYWQPADRQLTVELLIYTHPRTIRVPLEIKFGAGGVVPPPPSQS